MVAIKSSTFHYAILILYNTLMSYHLMISCMIVSLTEGKVDAITFGTGTGGTLAGRDRGSRIWMGGMHT